MYRPQISSELRRNQEWFLLEKPEYKKVFCARFIRTYISDPLCSTVFHCALFSTLLFCTTHGSINDTKWRLSSHNGSFFYAKFIRTCSSRAPLEHLSGRHLQQNEATSWEQWNDFSRGVVVVVIIIKFQLPSRDTTQKF